jgi:hypothetical protein
VFVALATTTVGDGTIALVEVADTVEGVSAAVLAGSGVATTADALLPSVLIAPSSMLSPRCPSTSIETLIAPTHSNDAAPRGPLWMKLENGISRALPLLGIFRRSIDAE